MSGGCPPACRPAGGSARAVTEKYRHELFNEIERALGAQHAEAMMEPLSPVGWDDVATKQDLDALRVATKHDLDALEERLDVRVDAVRREMATRDDLHLLRRDVITWILTAMGIQTAVMGLLFTVAAT